MKKLFTFIFAATLAVSCWGNDITIGGSGSNDWNAPFNLSKAKSASQSIYTAAELTAAGLPSGAKISQIDFKYGSSKSSYTRTLAVYITNKANDAATAYLSNYKFDKVTSSDLFFNSTVTLPETSASFYSLVLTSNFVWDGTSNICIIVCDNTNSAESSKYHKNSSVSSNPGRCIYSETAVNPTSSSTYVGYKTDYRPVIKFTYSTGGGGGSTPKITLDKSSVTLGTFDAQYEKDSATFVVKGSDLEGDITLSPGTGLEAIPSSITKAEIEDAGESGITVKVRTTSAFAFNSPKVTVSSLNATSQTVTVGGTQAEYVAQISIPALYNTAVGSYSTLAGPTEIASVDASNQTFVLGTTSQACTIDYTAVPGTYVALGKVSNLKVKKTGTGLFKAFAFDYAATGKTISETNENNQITHGTTANVTLNRTLVADGYYSTIYLPFAVTAEQIADQFGEGTVVQELTEASLSDNNNELTLNFSTVTAMVAGKPYLIKPIKGGNSFTFNNVTLDNTDRSYKSTNLDFIGTFDQINLTVGNKNTLLLGAENGLGWAQSSGTFKGLRAYFLVKYNSGASAPERLSTRMIFDNTTKTQEIQNNSTPMSDVHKFVNNGQLIIIRNGVKYNAQGARL